MAPDSDTIVVQLPEDLRTSSTLDDEMETDERHQDNPTTPIEQTTKKHQEITTREKPIPEQPRKETKSKGLNPSNLLGKGPNSTSIYYGRIPSIPKQTTTTTGLLTTTPTYSGEYLVQHKHIWHQKFELKNVQLLESWTKVVVHNVPTEWEGAETLEILHTEIPAYNNGLQITGNPYWISREWQNKKNSSIVIAFKTAEDAARLGGRITILGQTLFTENH
ncbi:hypothetical protein PtrM4_045820 [Pyrenophora tritici-repentis]|uniref:Uncharacterized protein n=1 Tax=Pyrenophora tritici-repentis TaxID=45151 RepID=A0A834VJF5_9PLEO|nr:hypothetical protein PtrM4_045820 [Pyrenophora tritici-repentis]